MPDFDDPVCFLRRRWICPPVLVVPVSRRRPAASTSLVGDRCRSCRSPIVQCRQAMMTQTAVAREDPAYVARSPYSSRLNASAKRTSGTGFARSGRRHRHHPPPASRRRYDAVLWRPSTPRKCPVGRTQRLTLR